MLVIDVQLVYLIVEHCDFNENFKSSHQVMICMVGRRYWTSSLVEKHYPVTVGDVGSNPISFAKFNGTVAPTGRA